jgi:hypothetical protein
MSAFFRCLSQGLSFSDKDSSEEFDQRYPLMISRFEG